MVELERIDSSIFQSNPFNKPWKGSNFVFIAEDEIFHVHSNILGLASPVFNRMFDSDFEENIDNVMRLPGKMKKNILEMLKLIYPISHNISGNEMKKLDGGVIFDHKSVNTQKFIPAFGIYSFEESDCGELLALAREYLIEKIRLLVDDYLNHILRRNENKDLILNNFELAVEYGLMRTIHQHVEHYTAIDDNCFTFGEWKNNEHDNKVKLLVNQFQGKDDLLLNEMGRLRLKCNTLSPEIVDLNKTYRSNPHTFSEEWNESDVTLHVDGTALHVHSNILRIASTKFDQVIQECENDETTINITISNVKKETVQLMLHIIYPNAVVLGDQMDFLELLTIARDYNIKRITFLVDDYMNLYFDIKEHYINKLDCSITPDTFVMVDKFDLHRSFRRHYNFIRLFLPDHQWKSTSFWKDISWKVKFIMFQDRFFPEVLELDRCRNKEICGASCNCGGFVISEAKLQELNDFSKVLQQLFVIT